MATDSPVQIVVDPVASALKAGERPDCSGLVLVAGWSWGKGDGNYQRLASEMASLDGEANHMYDGEYTHCTLGTLSRYVRHDAADDVVDKYCVRSGRALAKCSADVYSWLRPTVIGVHHYDQVCAECPPSTSYTILPS